MWPARPPKSSLFWLSFPSLLLLSLWTTLNNFSQSLLFTPFKYLWPMSQSLLVRARWSCRETCLFHLPSEGSPFRLINHICCSSMNAHPFLDNLPHFFVTHTAQKNPLCLSLLLQNKRMVVVECLLTESRGELFSHQASSYPGQWHHLVSYLWLSYLGVDCCVNNS